MPMHQLDLRVRKILETLRALRVRSAAPLANIEILSSPDGSWESFANGAEWGQTRKENWTWFRFSVHIPHDFPPGDAALRVLTGREGNWEAVHPQFLAYLDGREEQAFDTRHHEMRLPDASPGRSYTVRLEAYAHAESHGMPPVPPRLQVDLLCLCPETDALYYDLFVPWEAATLLPEGSRERERLLYALSDAVNLLDLRAPYTPAFLDSVEQARRFLRESLYAPLQGREPEAIATCVGHSHIDVAWLWDIEQTRHKAARTFSTMLKLMERYPEFTFMSSQAQLYQFVKEDHPALYARIRKAIRRGQWEPEGGMWVEADCNLISGESIVRQLLYGNEFFQTEFGHRCRILWLPDVFGYSAALPQILKKSGIKYFFTSKLSWSEFNLFPYDTFVWRGIDGSEVLTHFTPSRDYCGGGTYEKHEDLQHFTTYNALLSPNQIKGGWQRFQQKGLDNQFLVSYGYGDGGGGPTEEMLENARRLTASLPGVPAVRQDFAGAFFEGLAKRVMNDRRLPKWSGELYLEYHRGTYTAMARNKRSNRKLEILLREVELWCEYAREELGTAYPQEALRALWHQALTLQFHDILPGSSIQKVYEDSKSTYARLFEQAEALLGTAQRALTQEDSESLTLWNSLSRSRDDVVRFAAPEGVTALADAQGHQFPVQRLSDGSCVAFVQGLAPLSAVTLRFVRGPLQPFEALADASGFDTPLFCGRFDENMRIVSLIDRRTGRETVQPGHALNRLVVYDNRPHRYDAWDVNIYYPEKQWTLEHPESVEIVEQGPVLTAVRVRHRFGTSSIVQDMVFYHDLARIDFQTTVSWREAHGLLKAHFPVDVFCDSATFDIQYGNVRRPTHRNTSWDAARFEVCAHKWMDISEPGFGVAVLNDCKYGCSVHDNDMALTLLKSSTYPNPTADQEQHVFTYALCPHPGDWRSARVPDEAYALNIPVRTVAGRLHAGMPPASYARVNQPNIIIECVKAALHGEGGILRLYECYGLRCQATLTLARRPSCVRRISLMEEDGEVLETAENRVVLEVKPYEIVSLRIL